MSYDWYDNEDAGDLDMYMAAEYSAHCNEMRAEEQQREYDSLKELVERGTHTFDCEDCGTKLTPQNIATDNTLAWLCVVCDEG